MLPKRFARLLGAALPALLLASCALFNPARGLKSCRYEYRSFAFSAVDNEKTSWTVDIAVVNPNAKPVTLEKMRFAFLHSGDTLVTAWNPARRELPAGDSAVLSTSLDIPHALLQRLPPGILSDTKAEFTLVGDAYLQTWVGEVVVPGALKQNLHVDMPAQMAKVRTIFMQKLFRGFGRPAP
jgi:hypothetical protein